MIGAIVGDIVGSRFEFDNHKSKDFEFFHPDCRVTDDSVMTLAIGDALRAYRCGARLPCAAGYREGATSKIRRRELSED